MLRRSGDASVQWVPHERKEVSSMKKIILLLVLVVIGLAIAKAITGDEA